MSADQSKYTPRPWHYRPHRHDDWGWVRSDDGFIVACARAGREVPTQEANSYRAERRDPYEANARLIAAAPDLYEALRELVIFGPSAPAWEAAREALHKAEQVTESASQKD